jgi:hypothetical protein
MIEIGRKTVKTDFNLTAVSSQKILPVREGGGEAKTRTENLPVQVPSVTINTCLLSIHLRHHLQLLVSATEQTMYKCVAYRYFPPHLVSLSVKWWVLQHSVRRFDFRSSSTRLILRDDFITFSRHERLKTFLSSTSSSSSSSYPPASSTWQPSVLQKTKAYPISHLATRSKLGCPLVTHWGLRPPWFAATTGT